MGIRREPLYDGRTTVGRSMRIAMQRSFAAARKPTSSATDSPLMRIARANAPISRSVTLPIEHLAHQVVRVGEIERARAFAAAADLPDVAGDAHGSCLRGGLRNFRAAVGVQSSGR